MKVNIKNCNNIDIGEFDIDEGRLNIKYAINGTGKSTISKAIDAFVNNDEEKKNSLLPFKYYGNNGGGGRQNLRDAIILRKSQYLTKGI